MNRDQQLQRKLGILYPARSLVVVAGVLQIVKVYFAGKLIHDADYVDPETYLNGTDPLSDVDWASLFLNAGIFFCFVVVSIVACGLRLLSPAKSLLMLLPFGVIWAGTAVTFTIFTVQFYNDTSLVLLERPVQGWMRTWTSFFLNHLTLLFFFALSTNRFMGKPLASMCAPGCCGSPFRRQLRNDEGTNENQETMPPSAGSCFLFPAFLAILIILGSMLSMGAHVFSYLSTPLSSPGNTSSNFSSTPVSNTTTGGAVVPSTAQSAKVWLMWMVGLEIMLTVQVILSALQFHSNFGANEYKLIKLHKERKRRARSRWRICSPFVAAILMSFYMPFNGALFVFRCVTDDNLNSTISKTSMSIQLVTVALAMVAVLVSLRFLPRVKLLPEGSVMQGMGIFLLVFLLFLESFDIYLHNTFEPVYFLQFSLNAIGYFTLGMFFNVHWDLEDPTHQRACFFYASPFVLFIVFWVLIFVGLMYVLSGLEIPVNANNWTAFGRVFVELCLNVVIGNTSMLRLSRYMTHVADP